MTPFQHVLTFVVMLLGSAVQGAVGFGVNLIAAPVLVLINPDLVPGPVIVSSSVLNAMVIRRERAPHVWREMRWPIIGQVPGAIAGAAVLSVIAKANLTIFFAAMVLLAVLLSVSGLHPKRTPRNLAVAGLVSAFMGTAVGIGGPPIALLYQHATGPEIRAALSRFFGVGSLLSLTMLTVFGQFHLHDLWNGILLLPGMFVGYLLSGRLLAHVNRRHVRIAVLALSAGAAVVAILRAVLG